MAPELYKVAPASPVPLAVLVGALTGALHMVDTADQVAPAEVVLEEPAGARAQPPGVVPVVPEGLLRLVVVEAWARALKRYIARVA